MVEENTETIETTNSMTADSVTTTTAAASRSTSSDDQTGINCVVGHKKHYRQYH